MSDPEEKDDGIRYCNICLHVPDPQEFFKCELCEDEYCKDCIKDVNGLSICKECYSAKDYTHMLENYCVYLKEQVDSK